ncbi:hypothetical protein [Sorangium atrum]|uniref:Uncharacterized protein n=1 Tax=Sorangium atrum TaxID=2995308 RepID=A0ABT5CBM2_9BACT|nr:hypothetical protein [Sorangium aterium]MDC0683829.1 hypothetical protein [Sorangium aterium]
MLTLPPSVRVYVAAEPTDLRKSIVVLPRFRCRAGTARSADPVRRRRPRSGAKHLKAREHGATLARRRRSFSDLSGCAATIGRCGNQQDRPCGRHVPMMPSPNFTSTGTFYIWIRGTGINGNDNSASAGVDDTVIGTNDSPDETGTLTWQSQTINVASTGIHTVNV